MDDCDTPDCDMLIPPCDGILLTFSTEGVDQRKAFTTLQIDEVARSVNPDLLHDDLCYDKSKTLLSFVVGEFSAGRRVAFDSAENSLDRFESWKQDEDIGTYALWECEDELYTLLTNLKNNAVPSGSPPQHPLVVVCS